MTLDDLYQAATEAKNVDDLRSVLIAIINGSSAAVVRHGLANDPLPQVNCFDSERINEPDTLPPR